MGIKQWFTKKPTIQPESAKDLKNRVVEVLDFSEWIQRLKNEAANATIRVKRTHMVKGESSGYLGDPIIVSQIEASTFDRVLDELYGGGSYILEYWQGGDHRLMLKNSKPPMPVTHTIQVAGIPKPLPGRKAAAESAAQPKSVLGTLLKQLDTAEGIVALTALLALAKDFFITGKKDSGGLKDMVDSIGTIFGMMPAPADPIEELERYKRLSDVFAPTNKPPVNIGGGSGTTWDTLAKIAGQVLGNIVFNAQNNGGQKQGIASLQTPGVLSGNAPGSDPGIADPASQTVPPSASSPSPATGPSPQAKFVNAKIMSIQAGMEAKLDPLSIANDVWSLFIFLMEKQIVDEKFVQSLYTDPNGTFDQLIRVYAPQSATYPKLDEVKRVVVQYIQEDGQEEVETHAYNRVTEEESEDRVIQPGDPIILKDEERVRILGKEQSEEAVSQEVRAGAREPIVIEPNEPVAVLPDESGESMPAAPGEEQITVSGED
jgi:hypothetical protein